MECNRRQIVGSWQQEQGSFDAKWSVGTACVLGASPEQPWIPTWESLQAECSPASNGFVRQRQRCETGSIHRDKEMSDLQMCISLTGRRRSGLRQLPSGRCVGGNSQLPSGITVTKGGGSATNRCGLRLAAMASLDSAGVDSGSGAASPDLAARPLGCCRCKHITPKTHVMYM